MTHAIMQYPLIRFGSSKIDTIVAAYVLAGLRKKNPSAKIIFHGTDRALEVAKMFTDADEYLLIEKEVGGRGWPIRKVLISDVDKCMSVSWNRHQDWAEMCGVLPENPTLRDIPLFDWDGSPPLLIAPDVGYDTGVSRSYPNMDEVYSLLKAEGFDCVIISHKNRDNRHFETFRAQDVLQLFSMVKSSRGVLGVDTGIPHIAGVLGVPGIAITASFDGAGVFGIYSTIHQLQSTAPCAPCSNVKKISAACNIKCQALSDIAPLQVLDRVKRLLNEKVGLAC